MVFKSKFWKPSVAALVFLLVGGGSFTSAATKAPIASLGRDTAEEAKLKKYLDKDGGYKDKHGGYYNPAAGTYTDEFGGIVDNWQCYTYKNGDYKTKFGDFWEAATKTFKLASGEIMKSKDTTNKDAVAVLRQSVEENGGYDKDYIKRAMIEQIKAEHPQVP